MISDNLEEITFVNEKCTLLKEIATILHGNIKDCEDHYIHLCSNLLTYFCQQQYTVKMWIG